jgi:hypothetical protein
VNKIGKFEPDRLFAEEFVNYARPEKVFSQDDFRIALWKGSSARSASFISISESKQNPQSFNS